jgi:3-oxoacyl-(acyl-carrier-protein) synthase
VQWNPNGRREVVVTGLGVVSPSGVGIHQFWSSVLSGKVGTRKLTRFDTSNLQTEQGGEVPWFASDCVGTSNPQNVPRAAQLAIAASQMCLEDGQLIPAGENATDVGVVMGTVSSLRPSLESFGKSAIPQNSALRAKLSAADLSALVARKMNLSGPNVTVTTACAAGNSAISLAVEMIQKGRANLIVAGGSDQISHTMLMLFSQLRSLAPDFVRPFDRDREGLLLSEGAGALLLESREHAERRSARIYCKVLGHAAYSDSFHMTAPHPDGVGAVRSMKAALSMASLTPSDVGFVSAHGTGTKSNDLIEAKAISRVFGNYAPPVSALKSMIGHTQGAAAAIGAVTCALTLKNELIHPTANLRCLDPQCEIDIVVGSPRPLKRPIVISNAFGFGGNISCIVFGKNDLRIA